MSPGRQHAGFTAWTMAECMPSATSTVGVISMSETPIRPPGRRTRNVSANTTGLSTDRLITQLEMTTSMVLAGNGMASTVPFRNSTLVAPAFSVLANARGEHLLGHVQPVRLPGRADPARGQQDVDTAAGPEVEHPVTFAPLGQATRSVSAR